MTELESEQEQNEISDNYHTMTELYEHRHALLIALMRSHPKISWRANNNADGSGENGYFVAGMHLPTGDISYHLPGGYWEKLDYKGIATTLRAPEWDGHSREDFLSRLELEEWLCNNK